MNKTQRRILTAWVIVAVVLLLFPPFVLQHYSGALRHHAFGFLLTGCFGALRDAAVVNVGLLAVLELVAAAVAGVMFFVTKTPSSKQGTE